MKKFFLIFTFLSSLHAFAEQEGKTIEPLILKQTSVKPPLEYQSVFSVIELEDFSRENNTTSEILSFSPGAFIRDFGGFGQLKTLYILGSSNDQVFISLEGVRINSPLGGGGDLNGPSNPIAITDLSGLNFTADIKIRNDGLGFVTLFNTDQVAVFDTATDEINPFPFVAPFPAGLKADNPNSQIFEGVQNLAIRPGKPGTDFQGADIFFITGISQQLGSITTASLLPPE